MLVDAATNRLLTRLTGVEGPHNIQVAPDGRTVWAVSGHDALAVVVDAATYTLKGTVPTGESPAHVILTPDGKTAYVTNGGDNSVSAIDAETLRVVATIPVAISAPMEWPATLTGPRESSSSRSPNHPTKFSSRGGRPSGRPGDVRG